jgi:hypothetical protein
VGLGLDSPINGIGVNCLATLRLTDFQGKIQVLSLVSLTAHRSLPNLFQLSVKLRPAQRFELRSTKYPRNGSWGER